MTAAACQGCGAPVPIVGLEPARCRHCGGAPSLPPDIAGRLDALRREVARTETKAQQLDGELASFGEGVGFLEVGAAALLWGLIGGLMTGGAAGNLGEHEAFLDVLVHPPLDATDTFAGPTFWMAFFTLLGFSICCFFAGAARLAARTRVRFAFPAPPAVPGGPPGCRVCGRELTSHGVVRRCPACRSDNVVDGVHFQRVTVDLVARLGARERAVKNTLASRQRMVRWLEKLVLGPPFGVLLLAPIALWLGQPDPALWLAPLALFALALLFFAVAAMLPAPRARAR